MFVHCYFSTVGCTVIVLRKDMAYHLKQAIKSHVTLLKYQHSSACLPLFASCLDVLASENQELCSNIAQLQSQVKGLLSQEENLHRNLEKLASEKRGLYCNLQNLSSANQQLRHDLNKLASEKGQLHCELKDLASANKKLQENMESREQELQRDLERTQRKHDCVEQQGNWHANRLESLEKKYEELHKHQKLQKCMYIFAAVVIVFLAWFVV